MNYIYTLSDPRNSAVRYIGQSNNPQHRYKQHLQQPGIFKKGKWIKELKDLGIKSSLNIIWECEKENVDLWERVWIAMYLETGSNLLNSTPGGQSIHSKPDACKAIAQ